MASPYIVAVSYTHLDVYKRQLFIADDFKRRYPKFDIRVTILGHLQRGGIPVSYTHLERRAYHKESAELLAQKIDQALAHGLKVIFCVGEQQAEREANRYFEVVDEQLLSLIHICKTRSSLLHTISYAMSWSSWSRYVAWRALRTLSRLSMRRTICPFSSTLPLLISL